MENVPKFAADRMVARLARWLRLIGADVIAGESLHGAQLLQTARAEGRFVLTRDKRLRTAPEVLYLRSNDFRGQIREVLARFPFDPRAKAFSRCSRCNEMLVEVGREPVSRRVPPFVYASHERFSECPRCGRIYWNSSHPARALAELDALGL